MKKCYILLLSLLIVMYSFNTKCYAKDNCLKYHLGMCVLAFSETTNSSPIHNHNTTLIEIKRPKSKINEHKCKSMINGKCTEYYISTEKHDMRFLGEKEQENFCSDSFGLWYAIDDYAFSWSAMYGQAAKVYITNVEPGSPAAKAGLDIGDKITKINGIKVSKFESSNLDMYMQNMPSVNIEVKTKEKKKKKVLLTKENICITKDVEPYFNEYWSQICPLDLDYATSMLNYIGRIIYLTTPKYRNEYANSRNYLRNWADKKAQFRHSYNLCLANNYNKEDVNNCMDELVNRTLSNIDYEQELEIQRDYVKAQHEHAQAQKEQAKAMRAQAAATIYHGYSLQNQHVNVSGNIHHDVSGNINHNVNGTMYHNFNRLYW